MSHHLVVVKSQYLQKILKGSKTVECRLTKYRQPPFAAVKVGDHLWFKLAGGPVVAPSIDSSKPGSKSGGPAR